MLSALWVSERASVCPHTFCFKEQQSSVISRNTALHWKLLYPPAARAKLSPGRYTSNHELAASAVKFTQTSTKLMNNYLAPAVDRFWVFFVKRQFDWHIIIIIITSTTRRGSHFAPHFAGLSLLIPRCKKLFPRHGMKNFLPAPSFLRILAVAKSSGCYKRKLKLASPVNSLKAG